MKRNGEDSIGKGPQKRAKVEQDSTTLVEAKRRTCFDDLNVECLVEIFSNLETDQLNDLASMNRLFNEARNHPSLDQTRTAIINVCEQPHLRTLDELYETIASKRWAETAFSDQSNNKILKINGLKWINTASQSDDVRLASVTHLDVSQPPPDHSPRVLLPHFQIWNIARILPNLQQVDMSFLNQHGGALYFLTRNYICRNLKCVRWIGANRIDMLPPYYIGSGASVYRMLEELYIDSSNLVEEEHSLQLNFILHPTRFGGRLGRAYLFHHYPSLQRISMKGTTMTIGNWSWSRSEPVSQEMLIQIVRYHPSIRWFRSDLTDDNIAMLNAERPEVTLVNN